MDRDTISAAVLSVQDLLSRTKDSTTGRPMSSHFVRTSVGSAGLAASGAAVVVGAPLASTGSVVDIASTPLVLLSDRESRDLTSSSRTTRQRKTDRRGQIDCEQRKAKVRLMLVHANAWTALCRSLVLPTLLVALCVDLVRARETSASRSKCFVQDNAPQDLPTLCADRRTGSGARPEERTSEPSVDASGQQGEKLTAGGEGCQR